MISPDRLLTQRQIYNFLRTVTIKYEPIAEYINDRLIKQNHYVNFQDRESWKYYLNMVGKYHSSDTLMYVTSLDTRKPILFSPEVLAENLRTRAAYVPGGAYYKRLCETYPDQVDLIKSILFPVSSLEKAITAPNLSLLSYGDGYLEEYEQSVLIPEIEKFLEILIERWYFDFLDDEPYFYLTFWSSLWVYLAMLLMSSRVANIRTPYVHSWDLWNELEGEGLDNYSDILDREKSMMLYQNIGYLKANAGKQSNLVVLADGLLKSFGIGLYGRTVVQEAESGADRYQLTPQLVPVRIPADNVSTPAQIEIKTVDTVQSEIFEKNLTDSNTAEDVAIIERKLGDTTLNEFSTKFLEIKPVAQHKPYAEILNMFLMETLVVSIKQGFYTKPVEVLDPLTGNSIYLPPKELLALYNYATLQSMGLETDVFPSHISLYRSFTPEIGQPAKTLFYMGGVMYLSEVVDANAYLSGLTYDQHIQNPKEFSDNATRLWLRFMDHYMADQNTAMDKAHYAYAYLSDLCHSRRVESIDLVDGYDTYDEWLRTGGVDIYTTVLSQYEIQSDVRVHWANLADKIITTLIPINDILLKFGNFTLSDSGYTRLRELFVQLCSYRVVFLESERDTSEFVVGPKWSNGYGPDHIEVFTDFIVASQVNTIDSISVHENFYLHQGVTTDIISKMDSSATYTKTTTTEISSITATHQAEEFRIIVRHPATIMSQGALNLIYSAPTPVMVEPS